MQEVLGDVEISLDLPFIAITAVEGSRAMLCRTLRDDPARS